SPILNAPPWIQTMTGLLASAPPPVVHTLRYRQSSLWSPTGSAPSMDSKTGWMQALPKLATLSSPSQAVTGCGGFHRSGPTGGAANGMPLKTVMPFSVIPSNLPLSVCTLMSILLGSTASYRDRSKRDCVSLPAGREKPDLENIGDHCPYSMIRNASREH